MSTWASRRRWLRSCRRLPFGMTIGRSGSVQVGLDVVQSVKDYRIIAVWDLVFLEERFRPLFGTISSYSYRRSIHAQRLVYTILWLPSRYRHRAVVDSWGTAVPVCH